MEMMRRFVFAIAAVIFVQPPLWQQIQMEFGYQQMAA
jgi:hypothetical protein